jgi:urea transport system permease protein
MLAFFRNDMGFGGNNGFTDFKEILGVDLQSDTTRVVLVGADDRGARSSATARAGSSSRRGRAASSARIRDARTAQRFLGYRVESFKLWVFTVLGGHRRVAAGALYVPQVGIINPSEFAPINSIEVVIWVGSGRTRHVGRARRLGAGARELRQDVLHGCAARGMAVCASARSSCSSRCSCLAASWACCRRAW